MSGGYKKIMQQLFEVENKLSGKEYLLSIYYPTSGFNKERVKLELKSFILSNFRRESNWPNLNKLHHQIVEGISENINYLEKVDKGLAIFLKFNPKELKKGRQQEIGEEDIYISILGKEPEEEFFVGKTFNYDQLLWQEYRAENVLLLNIKPEEANVYKLENGELDRIESMKNSFVSDRENEYLERFSPTGYKNVVHGTGSDKWKRDLEDRIVGFLNQIIEAIRRGDKYDGDYNGLVIVYSDNVKDVIKKLVDELVKIMPTFDKPILINKNIPNENQLKEEVIRAIEDHKKKNKMEYLTWVMEEDRDNFVEGWKSVLKELRRQKIETLFYKEGSNKQGYLMDEELLYLNPVEGANNLRRLNNIAPWLLRNVLEYGGKVMVFDKEEEVPEVAARIRY